MKFIGIVLRNPLQTEELSQLYGLDRRGIVEITVRGKKLLFTYCKYRAGTALVEALRKAEERRRELKGSGVVCVLGVFDMERVVSPALDMGYDLFIFDSSGEFLYGKGLFPVIRIEDFKELSDWAERIL